jgi:hypothetical protein
MRHPTASARSATPRSSAARIAVRAKQELGLTSVAEVHTGAVTFIQRFDSALRLNPHLHALALDGVYVRDPDDGQLRFRPLPPPGDSRYGRHVGSASASPSLRNTDVCHTLMAWQSIV